MHENIIPRENLEKSIPLKNGLTLELWDKSRVMAGDRWKITVTAQVDVPVEKALEEPISNIQVNFDEIKTLMGESVRFEKKMERFFIDEKEKDETIQNLVDSLLESLLPYVSHPKFISRFVISEFTRAKQKALLCKNQD